MSSPGISIRNANLTFEDKVLFSNLHLELLASKFTCLLGPSGVGKTSLLRMIAGLNVGAQLSAEIIASDNLPLKNRIAYMSQTDALLPWLTVLENILIGNRLRGQKITSSEKDKAIQLLKCVNLEKDLDKKPEALSGGMRQRVALARTLYEDEPIVLMDEPFASLDAITKWRLQALTAQLLKNKTVLLVTHDPLEALRLAHHVYVLTGLPASISEEITLSDLPPRDLHHPRINEWQSQLIEQLEKAEI